MGKHTNEDLVQMQSLPLELKIKMTKRRIEEWYDYWDGNVYVSFSGGKDSTVLKHIIDTMYDDVPSVFVDTGLEYPEIKKFVKMIGGGYYDCLNSNIEIIRPQMRFDEVVKKYGYPLVSKEVANTIHSARNSLRKGVYSFRLCKLGVEPEEYGGLKCDERYDYKSLLYGTKRSKFIQKKWRFLLDSDFKISHLCCDAMKKRPMAKYEKESNRKPFLGIMAYESNLRRTKWMNQGCNAFDAQRPESSPLSFWTENDVLKYIVQYNVPYCSVYGDIVNQNGNLKTTGCDRTGCIFCAFGCHLEGEPNRFQRLKITHPKQYEYCIDGGEYVDGIWQPNKNGLGLGKVLDYINVKY